MPNPQKYTRVVELGSQITAYHWEISLTLRPPSCAIIRQTRRQAPLVDLETRPMCVQLLHFR